MSRGPSEAREAKVALHVLCDGCLGVCGWPQEVRVGGVWRVNEICLKNDKTSFCSLLWFIEKVMV